MSRNPDDYETLNYDAAATPPEVPLSPYRPEHVIAPLVGNANEEGWNGIHTANKQGAKLVKGWVPIPLRLWFWIPLVTVMILLAIGLEIALHRSNVNSGWATFNNLMPETTLANYYHYAYTQPPVIVAMVLVALWAWVDIEIQKMQPYIDLVRGNASADKSLLLDYTRSNKLFVWISAFSNRHYMVAFVTLVALLALLIEPLCASMFVVKNTWWGPDPFNVTNLASLSLNEGPAFQDLTVFLSAAGYAASSVLYNFGDPPFIHDVYTIGPFQIPGTNGGFNGTVTANTTAIKTETNCSPMTTNSTPISGGGWINNATFNGCTFSYTVSPGVNHLFGAAIMPDCNNTGTPAYFRPTVFWFFTFDTTPGPQGSATYCAPTISLWDVTALIDINTGNLTDVQEIQPFDSSTSPFASLSANLTGSPLNGRAFNGIVFNLTNPDQFVIGRSNATDLQLPASIFQAATTAPGGLPAAFQSNSFVGMATKVYGVYLRLLATTVYFLPSNDTLLVEVQSFQRRLWLSGVVVHLQAVVLVVIALVGAFVQVAHRKSRQQLRLQHIPGTLASAISIGAETNLAQLLNGQQDENFTQALRNKQFRIDPRTMKIVMQGDYGYEEAVSPGFHRSSEK